LSSRAVVTGIAGQDGSYLAECLLERDYGVVGIVQDASRDYSNLAGVRDRIELVETNLLDHGALAALLREHRPTEIYNLASPSFVPRSWDQPLETAEFAAVGMTSLLEALRSVDESIRLYQASSAAVFGDPVETPQTEQTPYRARSPYGAAKAFADFLVAGYRDQYGLHASCGILFNHESPRRSHEFLPAKVAHAAVAIARGRETELVLGGLDSRRDWGYAPDFVEAMWRMLQQDAPDDYVIATGELHSVRELVELAFAHVGLDWREHVRVDESLVRRVDHPIVGDASKARARLGWRPTVTFEQLVALLVDAAS